MRFESLKTMSELSLIETLLIALVEGLTEFLPVSSTGHMVIVQSLLGIESTDFVKAFIVIIQFGAILSVVFLYRKRFFRLQEVPQDGPPSGLRRLLYRYDFYCKLLLGFLPAAVVGLLFHDQIDALLESVPVVAAMLLLGGLFMLFIERIFPPQKKSGTLTPRKAVRIGLFQCLAMIPGVSRSMATIVGGMSQRLSRAEATEFSFFLAVPTMFAATGYKFFQLLMAGDFQVLVANGPTLLLGNLVAFLVALLAIKLFISYVTRYGFTVFGWYRIFLGGGLLLMYSLG